MERFRRMTAGSLWAAAMGLRTLRTDASGGDRIWDARTGEPLTPPFRHPESVVFLQWAAGTKRLVTRTRAGQTYVWPLPRDHRPAEDLSLIAQLLSSQRSLAMQTLIPESRAGLAEAWQKLRHKYPLEFSPQPR